ncbi:MAG: dephospho-CoA kinase [Bacteroidetes bacterium]|nr:dephospho-CoA kinase [Bacteroidota bacterium]
MKKVGITGGIASGKTTAARIIESLGYPVFYADPVAKDIMANDPEVQTEIRALIGKEAYLADGSLNKLLLASELFSKKDIRKAVNSLVHPRVLNRFMEFCKSHQNSELVFHEAALIYQAGFDKFLDNVIFVTCSREHQIQRGLDRGLTYPDILNRIESQGNLEEFRQRALFTIRNDSTIQDLTTHVSQIIRSLKQG